MRYFKWVTRPLDIIPGFAWVDGEDAREYESEVRAWITGPDLKLISWIGPEPVEIPISIDSGLIGHPDPHLTISVEEALTELRLMPPDAMGLADYYQRAADLVSHIAYRCGAIVSKVHPDRIEAWVTTQACNVANAGPKPGCNTEGEKRQGHDNIRSSIQENRV